MGKDITQVFLSREDRALYQSRMSRCLDVLAFMLKNCRFDIDRPMTGMEIELSLVDMFDDPVMRNAEILTGIADPSFQSELGRLNLELNTVPRLIARDNFEKYERDILTSLREINTYAGRFGSRTVLIGILPTLTREHAVAENLSSNTRFQLLNRELTAASGGNFDIDIQGVERLTISADSIAPEFACTSTQFHLQVTPGKFSQYWNAAQAISPIQVAIGANSPFLFGKRLWDETRIALFEQSTDTRSEDLKIRGEYPRVWFGRRWITSVIELFEENMRCFPVVLPLADEEDPYEVLRQGGIPHLTELSLHNGTIYRWNRPVYDIYDGRPHLRVENRVVPSGPTVIDTLANAAFFYGLVQSVAESEQPIWKAVPFSQARENFYSAARDGLEAKLRWPGFDNVSASELVMEELLPLAYSGLNQYKVDPHIRDRLLGIIEGRCVNRQNGSVWQSAVVRSLEQRHNLDRFSAVKIMLNQYRERMTTNEPVHLWPI